MKEEVVGEFKERLKEALNLRNMRQFELCEKTGIGKSSVNQYLRGYTKPKMDKLYLMAKALRVNEAWLMGYDVPMVNDEEDWYKSQVNEYYELSLREVYKKFGYNAFVTLYIYENLSTEEREKVIDYATYTAEKKGIAIPTEEEIRLKIEMDNKQDD